MQSFVDKVEGMLLPSIFPDQSLAIAVSLIERYKCNGWPISGLYKIGGLERYFLNSANTTLYSYVHSKVLSFLDNAKKGSVFWSDAAKNLERRLSSLSNVEPPLQRSDFSSPRSLDTY